MEKAVKVTVEKAPGQIIVRNNLGAEWKYYYKNFDVSISVTAAAIAMAQINSTFATCLVKLFDDYDTVTFELKHEEK